MTANSTDYGPWVLCLLGLVLLWFLAFRAFPQLPRWLAVASFCFFAFLIAGEQAQSEALETIGWMGFPVLALLYALGKTIQRARTIGRE